MKTISCLALVLVLSLYIGAIGCDDDISECTTGGACFEDGQLPDWVSPTTTAYYCCLQRNRTQRGQRQPDRTFNCSCVLDLSLPSRIEAWAEGTRDLGRMCARDDCEGADVTSTVSERFHYCCYGKGRVDVRSEITFIDGDKEEFIGCRCVNSSVPTPDPEAYVVPPVMAYNSTGEVCSYDKACQDRPAVKCEPHGFADVTFCCYGSRGLVAENDEGGTFARCTCSDEVYGAQCEANLITIAQTTSSCLTDCNSTADEDKCIDSSKDERCCPRNMAVVASQSDGSFTSCMCQAQATKNCDTTLTSAACLTDCNSTAVEDKCIDSSKAERCCPNNLAVVASQSDGSFTSCTCVAQATRNCDTTPASSATRFGGRLSDVILLVLALLLIGQV